MAKRKVAKKTKSPVKRKAAKKTKSPAKRKKTAVKKPTKKKVAKKKAPRKSKESSVDNRVAMWKAYHELQQRADKAWAKLQNDAKRKAKPEVLLADQNHLLLLLGECDYMARECMRMAKAHEQ